MIKISRKRIALSSSSFSYLSRRSLAHSINFNEGNIHYILLKTQGCYFFRFIDIYQLPVSVRGTSQLRAGPVQLLAPIYLLQISYPHCAYLLNTGFLLISKFEDSRHSSGLQPEVYIYDLKLPTFSARIITSEQRNSTCNSCYRSQMHSLSQ